MANVAITGLTAVTAPAGTKLVELDAGQSTSLTNLTKALALATSSLQGVINGTTFDLIASALQNVVEDTTPTLGGNLDGNDKEIQDYVTLRQAIKVKTHTQATPGTYTPSAADGNYHVVNIQDDTTIGEPTATGVPAVAGTIFQMVIHCIVDATGGYTTDIVAGFDFRGGEPVIANGANEHTIFVIQTRDQGTSWEVIGDFDLTQLATVTAVSGDFMLLSDTSDSAALKKADIADLALTGPTIAAYTTVKALLADEIPIADVSAADAIKKVTVETIRNAASTVTAAETAGASQTPDMAVANSYRYNLSADLTINAATNRAAAGEEILRFEIEADGTNNVTWNAEYDFGDQTAPVFASDLNGDVRRFVAYARDGGAWDIMEAGVVW